VTALDRRPEVVGKPHPPLFDRARARTGAHTLMVGDRLDTDIAGARAAGLDTLLVLTGVARARDLLAAPEDSRPTYVGADLSVLSQPQPPVELTGDSARCDGVRVTSAGVVTGAQGPGAAVAGLRAAAALAWANQLPEQTWDECVAALGLT
jgi:glycerol-1-phosphatase